MIVKGEFKLTRAQSMLSRYERILKKDLDTLLKKEASAAVSNTGTKYASLVTATPPHQLDDFPQSTVEVRKTGEAAVKRGIRQVYGTPGELYGIIRKKVGKPLADNFWAYLSTGRFADANAVARLHTGLELKPFDAGRAHKARRNSRGRVGGKYKSVFVQDQHSLKTYIKEKQKKVGLLAAAMVAAGRIAFGKVNGVPSWVGRHTAPWGNITYQDGIWIFRIDAPYSGLSLQKHFTSVMRYRAGAFKNQLPFIYENAAKKSGLTR